MDRITPEQYDQLITDQGLLVQSALHSYFLKRAERNELKIEVQDVNSINSILVKSGIDKSTIDGWSSMELCELLGVDAIVTGVFTSDKPMSDGAAFALMAGLGVYSATNVGSCSIRIHNGETGDLLWKYDRTLAQTAGSTTQTVVNSIMRKASKQLHTSLSNS
ncbi:MAG: hypothetical protein KF775_04370 [Cyclobacteriaceae bacterium]|nr:hypothetical protein [Cyclobacteriaceae bacterium]